MKIGLALLICLVAPATTLFVQTKSTKMKIQPPQVACNLGFHELEEQSNYFIAEKRSGSVCL